VSLDGQILILNAGSSSLKLGLFDATGEEELAVGQTDADDADGGDVTGGAFSEAPPT